jgi:hypothetical protein
MSADVIKSPIRLDVPPVSGLGSVPIKCHKRTVTHADLTDADTSQAIDITVGDDGTEIPANAWIISASCLTQVAFTGGGNTAVVVEIGDAADPNELLTSSSVFTVGFDYAPGVYAPFTAPEADYTPLATFTSTTGTVAGLTAGVLECYVHYWVPTNPRA